MGNIFDTSEYDKYINNSDEETIKYIAFENMFKGIDLVLDNIHIAGDDEIVLEIRELLIGFNSFLLGRKVYKSGYNIEEFMEDAHKF